jgi:hypothetical protein
MTACPGEWFSNVPRSSPYKRRSHAAVRRARATSAAFNFLSDRERARFVR